MQKDFLACQALMSPALAKLGNAKADFPQQKAYLKEQESSAQFKIELKDSALMNLIEEYTVSHGI